MMQLKNKIKAILRALVEFTSSKHFFIAILVLAAVQGLWYALSFKLIIFDEAQHFGMIDLYSNRINPLISNQNTSQDYLGEITRNPFYIYYYLLSWPLRFMQMFTSSLFAQVFVIRAIHIAAFVYGLFSFKKLFNYLNLKHYLANFSLLVLILVPGFAPFPGAINYDNIIFFLFPILLIFMLKIIRSERAMLKNIAWFCVIALSMGLTKPQSLALVIVPMFLVLWFLIKKHKNKKLRELSIITPSIRKFIKFAPLLLLLLILGILFTERTVINQLKYGNLRPRCTLILSEERCYEHYTYKRSIDALDSKPAGFIPVSKYEYFANFWIPGMTKTAIRQVPNNDINNYLFTYFSSLIFIGFVVSLLAGREIVKKHKELSYLMAPAIFFLIILFFHLYASYNRLGIPVAISARYLLPIAPLLIIFALSSAQRLIKAEKGFALVLVAVVLLLVGLGGSVFTYALDAPVNYQWEVQEVNTVNDWIKSFSKMTIGN